MTGVLHIQTTQTIGPFDNNNRSGIVQEFIQTEFMCLVPVDPVEIDVVHGNRAGVLIDKGKRRTRDIPGIVNAESDGEAPGESRFTGSQIANEKNASGALELSGQAYPEFERLLLRMGDARRHVGSPSDSPRTSAQASASNIVKSVAVNVSSP